MNEVRVFSQAEKTTLTFMALRGMFLYLADSAFFEECMTRRKLPVMMEDDYLALERAYSSALRMPGEWIVATVEGRIAERAGMEGPPRPSFMPA